MSLTPIRAIISDLDGVIRTYPDSRNHEYEIKNSIPTGTIIQCAFAHADLDMVVRGKIADAAWRKNISERLSKTNKTLDATQIISEWSDFPGQLDVQVIDLLKKHKFGRPLILMTNGTDKLNKDLHRLNISEQFDMVINSSEIGFAKPDKEIFQYALGKTDFRPNEIAFIDDRKVNIEVAREMGFFCHHFTGHDEFKKFCKRLN